MAKKNEVKINEKEVADLMRKLGISREEAIDCWKCDNGIEENEEVETLTKKAKENKTTIVDGNVTKGQKKPRTYVSCDEKVELFNLIKDTLTDNCDKVEVSKENKLLEVVYKGVQFKVDLIKTNTALAEKKGKTT